ncbi:E3 ubiquitin-protein ligase MARCH11-like isoform X1 [Punica granatum]|nr:E3 ubiquitin-protein ligase MARCH11-like isoform X1 [Punica granatum]OWM67152.1 hypothetical protein CDL15_Pgr000604 [Punica granatum]
METTRAPGPDIELGAGVQHRRGERDAGFGCWEDNDGGEAAAAAATSSSSSGCSRFPSTGTGSRDGESGSFRSRSVEIEGGDREVKVDVGGFERDCRICHLGLGRNGDRSIDLGCSCKGDLAAAHKNCAEDWFNIRGNRTCEICHSVAQNVATPNEADPTGHTGGANANIMSISAVSTLASPDHRSFWDGHRFLNFLLACMVVAFVISWLFHFRVPSHH